MDSIIKIVLLMTAATVSVAETTAEPVTLDNVAAPAANSADEPVAAQFSANQAKHFLDSSAVNWQKEFKCMTCHTNFLYLMSRPAFKIDDEPHRTVRRYAEGLVEKRWNEEGPRWDAEVIMTALVLAGNDAQTSGELHPLTRQALDRIWTVQLEDGGFDWLNCDWPPMESDDEFGAAMAALAVSVAPGGYADTPAAQQGIEKLRGYLAKTPPPMLHHRAIWLWADTYRPGWITAEDRLKTLDDLLALQHENGGWSIASLGDWNREDDSTQDVDTSDGYATGLVVYLSRRAGLPADDPRLARGVAWLKANQRESGRWFTRSLHADSLHYISHAGTSMAVMALAACDQLK